MQPATQFTHWQHTGYPLADPDVADVQTHDCLTADCKQGRVIETFICIDESTESVNNLSGETRLSEDTRISSAAADRLRRELGDYGEGAIGMTELQNNNGPEWASVTSSLTDEVVTNGSKSSNISQEISINTQLNIPVTSAVLAWLDVPLLPAANPGKISHPENAIRSFPKMKQRNALKKSSSCFKINPSKIRQTTTHGDFSESSEGNPIAISNRMPTRNLRGNNVRIVRKNPASLSFRENSAETFQNNLIGISTQDSTVDQELGNSLRISLQEMGNPFALNSPKLNEGNSTAKSEEDFPLRHLESLANSSNVAGTEAEPSEAKGGNKSAPPASDSAAPNENNEKVIEASEEGKRLKTTSKSESADAERSTVKGSCINKNRKNEFCVVTDIKIRTLWLLVYYFVLWVIISLFTWGLLELSLVVTSKGNYPYYMSPHSYCMTSPAIGFVASDPEPGKVTTFKNLTHIAAKINAALGELVESARDCDTPATAAVSLSEDALRIPCSMERFAAAMKTKTRQVLADRPAVMVQVKRHLGYLPAKGPAVTVTCKSQLALKYFSWNGKEIVESQSSGTVPTDYFPMLTQQHSVPSVLVAIDSASKSDWSGKEVAIKCTPSDGGSTQPAEKSIILVVKA